MTTYYVDSAASGTASPYDTWAKAAITLDTITAIDGAGDVIYVASSHAETPKTASMTLAFAGTLASPTKCYGVTKNSPPDTLATGAVVATGNGAYNITINGDAYVYGITFKSGVGNTSSGITVNVGSSAGDKLSFEQCTFVQAGSGNTANSRINVGLDSTSNTAPDIRWINCNVELGHAINAIRPTTCFFTWSGGAISGGAAITTIFKPGGSSSRVTRCLIEGVDFTGAATNANLVDVADFSCSQMVFRNCKLPSSCVIKTGTWAFPNQRIEVHNCDSGDTNYRLHVDSYLGTIKDSISAGWTVYRDSGAGGDGLYNGATKQDGMSWLMSGSSACLFPLMVLRSTEIVQWCGSTGGKTVTVEICHDGANALTDQEVWLEVQYLSTSGVPLVSITSDRCGLLVSASAQSTTSAATWTGDSGTGPNSSTTWHLLRLVTPTITVNEIGYIHATVCLAANKSVFVDPVLTVA